MIRIITDSTCEAPPELLGHPAVSVVPLTVIFGQETFLDNVDITREQFWARLTSSVKLPTTSQATPGQFQPLFHKFTDAGDEVIVIVISAKLSQTYNSALIAKEGIPDRPIDVIDSRTTSVGLGLMLQEAVAMAEAGVSRSEITARLTQMRDAIHVIFVVETLEYLQRGGRIGKAQAFAGTLLKLKPLLSIVDGEVTPEARVRSRVKALETMQELLQQKVSARGPQVRLALMHAQAASEAARVGQSLAAKFGTSRMFIAELGPALGTHVGPGTIGAAVYAGS